MVPSMKLRRIEYPAKPAGPHFHIAMGEDADEGGNRRDPQEYELRGAGKIEERLA